MKRNLCGFAAAGPLLLAVAASPVSAQKQGGTLTIGHFDSPASISLLEESTNAVNRPMMAGFNNLVMYDQNVPQNSPNSIVPDLATSWSWNEEGTELTLPLRQGVKWHDGKPFTANDVKCTLDLLTGKSAEKLRINPRKSWFDNLEKVSSNGDYEVTFHLKRAQPAFLASLATGWSPIYPCHVSPRDMRTRPIGTGPFKFVEFQPNQFIRIAKNPEYWKAGKPHLDGIEYPIIKDVSTRLLTFMSGKSDFYPGVTMPQLKDVKNQARTRSAKYSLPMSVAICSSTGMRHLSTMPICDARCRSASTASRSSTSSPPARVKSAGRCSRCPAGSGGCRQTC